MTTFTLRPQAELASTTEPAWPGEEIGATVLNHAPPLVTQILFQTLVSVVVCFAVTVAWMV